MKTALLIIDIQNFYVKMLEGFENASGNAKKILEAFRKNGLSVFHVMHIKKIPVVDKLVPLEKMPVIQIHESVKPAGGEQVIMKYDINCFKDTALLDSLKKEKIEKLVICGMMTHMCVDAAVRAGHDFGFEILVIHDACATKALEFNGKKVSAEEVNTAMFAAFEFAYAKLTDTENFINNFKKLAL